jgi:hypothetical protein
VSGPWLPLQAATIPAELRALGWVLWRAEPPGADKPAKVPYQIADPMVPASSTDPSTWGTFADAVEAAGALVDRPAHPIRGPVAGVGVVVTRAARRSSARPRSSAPRPTSRCCRQASSMTCG